jgi:hypothetical protein
VQDFDPQRVRASGISCRYYNPGIHVSSFMLPTFIADEMGEVIDPIDFSIFHKWARKTSNGHKEHGR